MVRHNRRGMAQVRLTADEYSEWLDEDPKPVVGDITLEQAPGETEDAVFFELRKFTSEVLPERYRDQLIIYGAHDEFDGFKVYATPADYEFLLMAHQRHGPEPFMIGPDVFPGNHAHFHELGLRARGKNKSIRIVTEALREDMSAPEVLDAFLKEYDFEVQVEVDSTATPLAEKRRQAPLSDYF